MIVIPLSMLEHYGISWKFICSQLKGCEKKDLKKEVTEMIELLQLVDKTNVQSCKLSGGMKRKLSVGIALIHGSKVRSDHPLNI